jgi:two-component sensor histidine kinase
LRRRCCTAEYRYSDDNAAASRPPLAISRSHLGRKQAEGDELLAGEMSHLVKNLLAIASGLTAITSQSAKTTADMAKELTHRLAALGRAHELVRRFRVTEEKPPFSATC